MTRAGPHDRPKPDARRSAYTILEVLVVLAVIGVLMAVGAGAYLKMRRSYNFRAMYARGKNVIRAVANSSRMNQTGGVVHWEKARGVVWGSVRELVGKWAFESIDADGITAGAFDRNGEVHGAEEAFGRIGNALYFGGDGAYVDLGSTHPWNPMEGIALEAWVYPESYADNGEDGGVIVGRRGSYVLRILGDGLLDAQFGDAFCDSGSFSMALHQWSHVGMYADRDGIHVTINGVERGKGPPYAEWRPVIANTTISAPDAPWHGFIDEVAIYTVHCSNRVELPGDMQWIGDIDEIHFTPMGFLDVRYHAGPVHLGLMEGRLRREFTISLAGGLLEDG